MPTTFHLRVWTRFLAPPEAVWAARTDPARVPAEFAPWTRFVPEAAFGEALAAGRTGRFSARFGPLLPLMGWPVELVAVEPPRRFVDHSQNALFARFEHEHLFEPTADGCRSIDAVTFTPALPAQKLAAILTERLFRHRHRVVAAALPADPQVTAVSVLRVDAPPS